jgi:hypothetical protein
VAGTHAHNSLFGSGIDSDLEDDEFDDFGSESSFSSVGSVGLSALTIDHESPADELTNKLAGASARGAPAAERDGAAAIGGRSCRRPS